MKITVKKTALVDYKIYIQGENKDGIYNLMIDTSNKENFRYLKEKLLKFPWTHKCKTWGDVLKNFNGKEIDLQKKFIIKKVA